jgi:glucose-6-phosphate isomerase
MTHADEWARYCQELLVDPATGFALDLSRRALDEMRALEAGSIANPDEGRRVGHYWLRAPELAPDEPTREAITAALSQVRALAADVRTGRVRPPRAPRFTTVLVVGIGGSTLGPQLVSDALGGRATRCACASSTTPTPTASTARWPTPACSARRSRW